MTRDERLAALEKKAQRLRERAADIAKSKRLILKDKAVAQRDIDTRWKIIYGAAAISAGLTGQLSQHISEKDREWMATHPMSQPKPPEAEPQKQSPAPVQTRVANPAPAPVANPAPVQPQTLVQRMFKP